MEYNWIENNPFKMCFIIMGIVSVFALMFHYFGVSPHDWLGFFVWIPIYNSFLLIPPSLNYLFGSK